MFLSCCFVAMAVACSQTTVDQKAEAENLMELSRQWAETAQGDDLEKILNYWAEDAVVFSPDQPSARGHEEIMNMIEGSKEIPGFEINWEPKEAFVSESGDMGYVLARNYFRFQDSTGNFITVYGNAVEIWRKQPDGTWKNVVDIYNSDPTITSIK